jgi:ABC-type multidrug transport system fused ATPase/permease subunit
MDGLESEAYDRKYSDRQLLSRIASYFAPFRARIGAVGAVLAAASLADFASQVVVSRSLDAARARPEPIIIAAITAAVILFGCIEWLFNYLRYFLSGRIVGETIWRLRRDAFAAAVRHDLSFYDEQASGKVVSRITTDTEDFANIVGLVVDFLSQIVLVVVFFGYLAFLNWRLALLVLAMAPLAVGVALAFRRIARFVTMNAKRVTAEVNAQIQESIAGIGVAKGFRREKALWRTFKANNRLAYRFGLRRGIVMQLIFPAVGLFSSLGTAFIAWRAGLLTQNGGLTLGQWYIFMAGVAFFWWPMLNIASFWSQLQDGLAAAERVFSLIDREPRLRQTGDHRTGIAIRAADDVGGAIGSAKDSGNDRIRGEVEFRKLDFAYSSKEQVLAGFDLHIAEGEKLAIVGRTGAGKSSIVKLIARFYEFQGGGLLLDGRDIRTWSLDAVRGAIGFVAQDPFLFPGTVADNIRYSQPDATDEAVEAAARSLGRGDWVDDLPAGLATATGHRGSSLSMGQRQLVVLARILLKDPRIFILDEATASVDPFTEAQIQEGLETIMEGRTAIVIAHRLSTVRFADRIVVLEKGRIMEEGSHQGLLERGGEYSRLYETYFRHQSLEYLETVGRR